MNQYTPEQVEKYARYAAEHSQVVAAMLRAYAATLRQQAGRVDEGMVEAAKEQTASGCPCDTCERIRAALTQYATLAGEGQ